MQRYCAYQDRCHQEVRNKLLQLNIFGNELEDIMTLLIADGFLNEERYAKSYARGKFRIKKWGRNKIKQQLQLRHISSYCIKIAMGEIDEEEYYLTLKKLIENQLNKYQRLNNLIRKDKAIKYAHRRGFEAVLIFEVIKEFESNSDILW